MLLLDIRIRDVQAMVFPSISEALRRTDTDSQKMICPVADI